jgi:hypothetical protein
MALNDTQIQNLGINPFLVTSISNVILVELNFEMHD